MPVVKAYPEPSKTYGTTVCVAGVRIPEGDWVRLYPLRFTELPKEQAFQKYQPFEAVVEKRAADKRPESYRIREESIRVLREPVTTEKNWHIRWPYFENAVVPSLCELRRSQEREGKSLGMIKVREVTGFRKVEADQEKFEKAQRRYEYAAMPDLFNENKLQIEPLSFKYQYQFLCTDPSCKGHRTSIIDWEAYQLHRKMVAEHGPEEAFEKVRHKFVDVICGEDKDTYFFMGNMARYPKDFLVLGTFYPKLEAMDSLF